MNVELSDVLKEFPMKNPAWMALDPLNVIVTDASDLGLRAGQPPDIENVKDPWNRRFPKPGRPIADKEQELVAWHFTTTIRGQEIECKIFND